MQKQTTYRRRFTITVFVFLVFFICFQFTYCSHLKKPSAGVLQTAEQNQRNVIDEYRLKVARLVQKNWIFSEQPEEKVTKLMASLVFKVMPNGEIQDIFFIDHSGDENLDRSAYEAVQRTSPVSPHPKGVSQPFVDVGLRFVPDGVQ